MGKPKNEWIFPMSVFLLLVILKLFLVFYLINPQGPTLFGDEYLYRMNSESIFNGQPYQSTQYPPIYPLVLSPAFLFGEDWYTVMLVINTIISSLMIFPIWLISKKILSPQLVFAPVILSAMLPFHAIYPRMILSENLFMFLFPLTIYLAVYRPRGQLFSGCLLGITCALAYMTRYLFLPAIPVLFAVWFIGPWISRKSEEKPEIRGQIKNLVIVFTLFLVFFLPWLTYAYYSGLDVARAFGYGISGLKSDSATISGLPFWFVAYAAYVVLVFAPWLGFLFVFFSGYRDIRAKQEERIFLLTLAALFLGYYLLMVQHSWGQFYNYPSPSYMVGRYFIQITPLCLIALVWITDKLFQRDSINKYRLFGFSVLAAAIAYVSHLILYRQLVWDLPPWFAQIVFNSPDVRAYDGRFTIWIAIFAIFATSVLVFLKDMVGSERKRLALVFLVIFAFQIVVFTSDTERMIGYGDRAIHGRIIAEEIKQDMKIGLTPVGVVYNVSDLDDRFLKLSIAFWGVPYSEFSLLKSTGEIDWSNFSKVYVITGKKMDCPEIKEYETLTRVYRIYENCTAGAP